MSFSPKSSASPVLYGTAGMALFLCAWQLVAIGPLQATSLPPASEAFVELAGMLASWSFWVQTLITAGVSLLGLAVSIVVGVVAGVLIGTSTVLRSATSAILEFIKPIPPIVILPIGVLILGPTLEMTMLLVVIGCAVPILVQTAAGVFDVDPVRIATARSYGMGQAEIHRRVVLPSASPFIATAIRVSSPVALMVTVLAGLLGGGPGLGRSLYQAQAAGDNPRVYAFVVVLGILGLIFQAVSQGLESKMLYWHESQRKVTT